MIYKELVGFEAMKNLAGNLPVGSGARRKAQKGKFTRTAENPRSTPHYFEVKRGGF